VLMPRWFNTKLTRAHALGNIGAALTPLVLGPVLPPMVATIGWQQMFLVLAAATALLLGLASALLIEPEESSRFSRISPPRDELPVGGTRLGIRLVARAASPAAAGASKVPSSRRRPLARASTRVLGLLARLDRRSPKPTPPNPSVPMRVAPPRPSCRRLWGGCNGVTPRCDAVTRRVGAAPYDASPRRDARWPNSHGDLLLTRMSSSVRPHAAVHVCVCPRRCRSRPRRTYPPPPRCQPRRPLRCRRHRPHLRRRRRRRRCSPTTSSSGRRQH
jgi:hypothetical protein